MVEIENGWTADSRAGFADANGRSVRQFDVIEHESGRQGVMLDATHDGDAYVILSGSARVEIVKWRSICKLPSAAEASLAAANKQADDCTARNTELMAIDRERSATIASQIQLLAAANAEIERLRERAAMVEKEAADMGADLAQLVASGGDEVALLKINRDLLERAEAAEASVATLTARVAKLEAGLRKLRSDLPVEAPPPWQDEFGYRSHGLEQQINALDGRRDALAAKLKAQEDKNHG